MTVALYATIWAALALFAAGDIGKRASRDHRWPWRAWALGVALASVHVPIALAARHDWSHARAAAATAERTAAVFGPGLAWGGGLYVNYAFIALWLGETLWWSVAPMGYAARPAWMRWSLRIAYAVVIVNAAVVFASPWGRVAGTLVLAALAWAWRPQRFSP